MDGELYDILEVLAGAVVFGTLVAVRLLRFVKGPPPPPPKGPDGSKNSKGKDHDG